MMSSDHDDLQRVEAEARQAARFAGISEAVNADAALVRRGRWLTTHFVLRIGSTGCFTAIRNGRIESIETKPQVMRASSFTIRAAARDWEAFWTPLPRPGWHDIFAMIKGGRAAIEGDIHILMCNLQYLKDVIATPRRVAEVIKDEGAHRANSWKVSASEHLGAKAPDLF
jgi:hypothetical protein